MKQLLISFLVLIISATSVSIANIQSTLVVVDTASPKKNSVKVTGWDSRAIHLLGNNYFAETKDEIVKQIGLARFEDMQKKCSSSGWPAAMDDTESDPELVDAKMNKLKMYKIGAYQHKYNGKLFDKYAIIEVPYTYNVDWDTNVIWEGSVYFLIKETDVEVIQ